MKKLFAVIFAMGMLSCNFSGFVVSAKEASTCEETISEEPIVENAGLISDRSLSISKNGTTLYITAETISNSTMKSIGFKDIIVEYSTNCFDWYEYKPPFDYTASSASSCYLTDYPISVTNGYYYRVTLNHYAKATGLLGSSQSVSNTSNVVS